MAFVGEVYGVNFACHIFHDINFATLKQVELWKKFIEWEKTNPLRSEDQTVIAKRVMFAYEQCLLCLGYHPDIW